MDEDDPRPGLEALRELVLRAAVASRLRSQSESRLLQSILDAAVVLFRAEAASLALKSETGETLDFVLSAGAHGAGVVGRSIAMGEGIAGYVSQTGQPIALASPADDVRFGRAIAEQTGYVPRSILAVPLLTPDRTVGVMEILDCRDGSFTAQDIAVASVFASQAAIAIDATRIERDFPILVANVLASYDLTLDPPTVEAIGRLQERSVDDFWSLVDEVAAMAQASPRLRAFVRDLLPLVSRHLQESRGPRFAR